MRDCFDTCSIISEIRDGVLKVRGNPEHPITSGFLCEKGNLLPKWFHSDERLREPLIRESFDEEFHSVSWDEALSLVASKMKETLNLSGPESILAYYYAGDRGIVNSLFPLRLFHYLNASVIDDGICSRAGKEALTDIYGSFHGMDPERLREQKLIIYWGLNPLWTNLHGYVIAKKYGLERWVVDVFRTETAKRCERFIQIKPESDVWLALGIAKVIVENELYDRDFIKDRVFGFEEFREYLERISPEEVCKESGVEREMLEEISFEYAEKRGVIHIGLGFQRTLNGGESVRAISMLPALVGHPRGFIYSHSIDKSYAEGVHLRRGELKKIPQMKIAEAIENGDVRFLYIYNSNPLASLPNQNRLRKAIAENDVFVVLHDLFMNETAMFSHVVLPASTFFERFDIADSFHHHYISVNQPVTRLCGKSNSEVTRELSRKLGLSEPALFESDESVARNVLRMNGIEYEELMRRGFVKIERRDDVYETESGKIEFLSRRAMKRGLKPFPEALKVEKKGLRLLTPTWKFSITSQYREIHGKEDRNVYLNPEDARERGLRDGDAVEVFNENGSIKRVLRISEDLPRGVAVIYKSFPLNKGEENLNFLTSDRVNELYGNASTFNSSFVEIRKVS
ncbi:MAG: molybdopterin-dependent oxidoreductase [Archaeoglobi archaeon]|nr:molybdopterin-dependent oxidoreductase [Candidatus Mnemosynella bozhongmuii]